MKFRDRFLAFMSGRYGADQLYYFLLAIYVILLGVNLFVRSWIISAVLWAVVIWLIFRSMSRNFAARRRENEVFMKVWGPVQRWFQRLKQRLTDHSHAYRVCPHCKSNLRLPRKRGKHTVPCPRCGTRFEVRILF